MKNTLILLLLSYSGWIECRADVKFLDFRKIDPSGQFRAHEQFLLDNLVYYDHWAPGWAYDVAKDSLITELKTCLGVYEPLTTDEFERYLLLGEIAHYLYNLDQKSYYDTAESFYQRAIKVNSKDCRGYWFLGYAYITSDEIGKGLAAFREALKLVDDRTGKDFWQEYAFAMELGGMPFRCRYAIDRYRRLGGNSLLSGIMDSTVGSKCRNTDPDIRYSNLALWRKQERGAQMEFLSYPLGMRLEFDTGRDVEFYDYADRMAAVGIRSRLLTGRNGKQFGYTVALLIRVPENGERLEDFMRSRMAKFPGVRDGVFPFEKKYPGGISYSYNDNKMYLDRGGARFRFIGIERPVPAHPGVALEADAFPATIDQDPGKLNFFTLGDVRSRFPERIFYLFVLDTCGDIEKDSWEGFQQLITQHMVLD